MGKKDGGRGGADQAESKGPTSREGNKLLGSPTFEELENGRLKCVETGHELPSHARDSYAQSKHCRLGLIDAALAQNRPPLNMFNQDPQSRSKLKCKLTGVTINKSEEHIWKHINGKRFLSMLERKETEQNIPNGKVGKVEDLKPEKKKKNKVKDEGLKKKKKKQDKTVSEVISEVRDASEDSDIEEEEEEDDFWMPPVGDRWDHDDGGNRWGSGSDSEPENGEANGEGTEEEKKDAGELSKRTKRISLEIGPSSYASRKKKKKTKAS